MFRYGKLFRIDKKTLSTLISDLEKKFYVSSKEKPLFEYLANDPESPEERNYPLRKRIGIREEL